MTPREDIAKLAAEASDEMIVYLHECLVSCAWNDIAGRGASVSEDPEAVERVCAEFVRLLPHLESQVRDAIET